jgi:hypothetical protein
MSGKRRVQSEFVLTQNFSTASLAHQRFTLAQLQVVFPEEFFNVGVPLTATQPHEEKRK